MSENTEKPYTLKSVKAELKRLEKSRVQKKEKIKTLTEEMKAENARIKELETIYDELYHEDLQKQIANAWFKKGGMTGEQIEKMLKLSKQIKDKIDILDVETVVKAVNAVYDEQTAENPVHSSDDSADTNESKEKVDTSSNFSENTSDRLQLYNSLNSKVG